ncbi:LytR C-terminal domain-containing protein [Demequina sp. NBRC 110055]|uniref:LytR C-terminal domain-containing protein n=1 Tax=Demequina sp. NBRC 110055 TaxID=1570344 RepID=UPI0009FFEBE5|nr:LytR C-terminal domain-containing protein [Demequina sp. NBRC 110055]
MSVARRRRRERQIIVFGVLAIVLAAMAVAAAAVVRGDAEGPFASSFTTPASDFQSDISLVCPPNGAMPVAYDQVVLRVDNGTELSGLAGNTATLLEARGFLVTGATNWARPYGDYVQIQFGANGIAQAYTLATQFEAPAGSTVNMVLDDRDDVTVDLVLGTGYSENEGLRDALSPELDMDLPLTAGAECLPANLLADSARPAPNVLPDNPLATAEPTAEPSAEPEGDGE